jgi:hypothetical protein
MMDFQTTSTKDSKTESIYEDGSNKSAQSPMRGLKNA